MTANPASPRETHDTTGTKLGYYLYNDGGTATAAFARVLNAAVVGTETHKSGSIAIASMVLHDAADVAAEGPLKIGGYASAAAPTSVSADADRVAAWFLRNGALAVNPVGGGGLAGILDDAAFTPGTSGVVMAGFEADETATDSVDEGDAGAGRMTLDRKIIVAQYAHTAGGATPYAALSSAAVLTAEVKSSAGQVYAIQGFNNGANEVFIRLYNQTGAPASTDGANIVWRGMIPGNAAAAGFSIPIPPGIACATGIGVRVSGAVADNDTTALAANEVMVNIQYK
jgi:hypothetical protein